jgi:hypothetical protein
VERLIVAGTSFVKVIVRRGSSLGCRTLEEWVGKSLWSLRGRDKIRTQLRTFVYCLTVQCLTLMVLVLI